jgi:dephospho-CoA kinase
VKVLGLTGSIGMGKTTASGLLRRLGVPVHDADREVHRLLGPRGMAVAAVAAAFPEAIRKGRVDRSVLGGIVFADPAALHRLERILHPLVHQAERRFLRRWARAPVVALDIPLLLETGGDIRCDAVAVVTAPSFLQAQRVLRRHDMTPDRLAAIRARQMPEAEKRRRADFVIPTGRGRGPVLRDLSRIVTLLTTPAFRSRRSRTRRHARTCSRYRNDRPQPS